MDLWSGLRNVFQQYGDHTALTNAEGGEVSYRKLIQTTEAEANGIVAGSGSKGRAAVISSHSYSDAVGILSALAAGYCVVPLSLKYGADYCRQVISLAEPDVILTDSEEYVQTKVGLQSKARIHVLGKDRRTGKRPDIERPDANDAAMILFTSGTTGTPKGVMLSHRNIQSNMEAIGGYLKLSPDDKTLIIRPLCHASVITRELLYSLMRGAHVAFFAEAFSPRRLLGYAEQLGCTYMGATPTQLYNLSAAGDRQLIPSLRQVTVSGECLQREVLQRILKRFPHVRFYNIYGLTETSPQATYLPAELFEEKPCSVGIPLDGMCIRIVDDNGGEVQPGQTGEVLIQGPSVMLGYLNDGELTKRRIREGWLHTGDLGYRDGDGYLYIVGRKDSMIIRGGVNIYPQEIENELLKHDAIKEALVWGERNPDSGQRICASVVPADGAALTPGDVLAVCREKLPLFKWPEKVEITDRLPRTASGKILRGK